MAMNRIQFQPGLSLLAFLEPFGTEAQCAATLEKARWPYGFRCARCDQAAHYVLHGGAHKTFPCHTCRLQTSLIAGTVFQSTHVPLTIWFLAIDLISQAKAGLSALALKRQLSVSYPTAWLLQQQLMQSMAERDARYTLNGAVHVDDAYLGGELTSGTAGRGSENKVRLSRQFRSAPRGTRCTSKWRRFLVLRGRPSPTGPSATSTPVVRSFPTAWPLTDAGCYRGPRS